MYTKTIKEVPLENIVQFYGQANMYCLEDMKRDILSHVKDTLTIESCWQLSNACVESCGDVEENVFQTCTIWIVDNIDSSSLTNFYTAKIEVATKFFHRCLDKKTNVKDPYPLSYMELYTLGKRYEDKNPQYKNKLTDILHTSGRVAVPFHLMNGHPFKISTESITKEEKFRDYKYQNNFLKAYWDTTQQVFRVYFDHDDCVWHIDINSTSEDISESDQDICITMGTLSLSAPRLWTFHVRRGLCVTIINQIPKRNIVIDTWNTTYTCLKRGEKMQIILEHTDEQYPTFKHILTPRKEYVQQDERGIYIRLRVDFPVSPHPPEDLWWLK